jgi:hypothetical protein
MEFDILDGTSKRSGDLLIRSWRKKVRQDVLFCRSQRLPAYCELVSRRHSPALSFRL